MSIICHDLASPLMVLNIQMSESDKPASTDSIKRMMSIVTTLQNVISPLSRTDIFIKQLQGLLGSKMKINTLIGPEFMQSKPIYSLVLFIIFSVLNKIKNIDLLVKIKKDKVEICGKGIDIAVENSLRTMEFVSCMIADHCEASSLNVFLDADIFIVRLI